MTQTQFLATVSAVLVGNIAFGFMAYAFFLMYWVEKKTGTKNWPNWVYSAILVPAFFVVVVMVTLVMPNGH